MVPQHGEILPAVQILRPSPPKDISFQGCYNSFGDFIQAGVLAERQYLKEHKLKALKLLHRSRAENTNRTYRLK